MQFRNHYLNCRLADTPYLLPYGQAITDHAAGMQVNAVGARLWDAVCQGADREHLLALLRAECEAEDSDLPELQKDLDDFLTMLLHQNMLLPDAGGLSSPYPKHMMQAGPLYVSLNAPDDLWEQYFSAFACSSTPQDPHQQIFIYPWKPAVHANGEILIRSKELLIAQTESGYLFLPFADSALEEMTVTADGARAEIYCRPLLTDADREEIFHAVRFAFLIAAAQHDLYVIHSASLLYRDRAWLFSGPSGSGKSTHTRLWKDMFHTPILNGDLNMVGLENGVPMCYGLPWCGTSGICTAQKRPLGGVVFLRQFPLDEVAVPSADKQILYLSQRMISPSWTPAQLAQTLAFCERLAGHIAVFRLLCTKEPHAAEVMREAVDSFLDDSRH